MGNEQAKVRELFDRIDKDDGGLTLNEILSSDPTSIRKTLGIERSPLLLFRFDESMDGSMSLKEFSNLFKSLKLARKKVKKLKKQGKLTQESDTPQVWTAVSRETADSFSLNRESETPAFTGRKPDQTDDPIQEGANKLSDQIERPQLKYLKREKKALFKYIEEELKVEAKRYFDRFTSTEDGKKQFISWLFALVDVHKKDIVTSTELFMLIKALRADGINPEDLTFNRKNLLKPSNPKNNEDEEDSEEDRKTTETTTTTTASTNTASKKRSITQNAQDAAEKGKKRTKDNINQSEGEDDEDVEEDDAETPTGNVPQNKLARNRSKRRDAGKVLNKSNAKFFDKPFKNLSEKTRTVSSSSSSEDTIRSTSSPRRLPSPDNLDEDNSSLEKFRKYPPSSFMMVKPRSKVEHQASSESDSETPGSTPMESPPDRRTVKKLKEKSVENVKLDKLEKEKDEEAVANDFPEKKTSSRKSRLVDKKSIKVDRGPEPGGGGDDDEDESSKEKDKLKLKRTKLITSVPMKKSSIKINNRDLDPNEDVEEEIHMKRSKLLNTTEIPATRKLKPVSRETEDENEEENSDKPKLNNNSKTKITISNEIPKRKKDQKNLPTTPRFPEPDPPDPDPDHDSVNKPKNPIKKNLPPLQTTPKSNEEDSTSSSIVQSPIIKSDKSDNINDEIEIKSDPEIEVTNHNNPKKKLIRLKSTEEISDELSNGDTADTTDKTEADKKKVKRKPLSPVLPDEPGDSDNEKPEHENVDKKKKIKKKQDADEPGDSDNEKPEHENPDKKKKIQKKQDADEVDNDNEKPEPENPEKKKKTKKKPEPEEGEKNEHEKVVETENPEKKKKSKKKPDSDGENDGEKGDSKTKKKNKIRGKSYEEESSSSYSSSSDGPVKALFSTLFSKKDSSTSSEDTEDEIDETENQEVTSPAPPDPDRAVAQKLLEEYDLGENGYLRKSDFQILANVILHIYGSQTYHNQGIRQIGAYRLKHKLGQGSVGIVRYAIDTRTAEACAIKIVMKGTQKANTLARLDTEIRAMMMLAHPHLLKLEGVMESDDSVFFIMELAGGGNLYDYMEGKALKEPLSRFFFSQIISGVNYCHKHGVVHRDLKLDNILLTNKAEVKISDFGHAGIFQKGWDIFSTSLVGGRTHISPEQIAGQNYSGEKIDIWSLGVILYQILTCKAPFTGAIENVMKVKYVMPEHISEEAKDLIANTLLLNPEKRLSCKLIRQHPWMKIGNTENPQLTHFKIIIKKNYELWKKNTVQRTMCEILQAIRMVPLVEPGTESCEEPIQCKYSPGNLTCDFTLGSRDDTEYFLFSLKEGESREFLAIKIQLLKKIKQREKHIQKQLKQQRLQQQQHISPPTKSKRAKTPTWTVFSKVPDKNTPKSPRKKSPAIEDKDRDKRVKVDSIPKRSPRSERRHQSVSKKIM